MIGYIYKIENKITGECYIGQTINLKQRKQKHFNTLRNNCHANQKLQNSFNKYGEENFSFTFWEFEIKDKEELNKLECDYIDKFNSLKNGFNLVEGGGQPPSHRTVKEEDAITYLCIDKFYGNSYGKTMEEIFSWSKGTTYRLRQKICYNDYIDKFEKISDEEQEKIAKKKFEELKIQEVYLQRQVKQGGCAKAYTLTQDDYNFAFAAQELGYKYTPVAEYFQIKPATVKDWFNGRSRKKNKEIYLNLSDKEKEEIKSRVKTAELSGKPKSIE